MFQLFHYCNFFILTTPFTYRTPLDLKWLLEYVSRICSAIELDRWDQYVCLGNQYLTILIHIYFLLSIYLSRGKDILSLSSHYSLRFSDCLWAFHNKYLLHASSTTIFSIDLVWHKYAFIWKEIFALSLLFNLNYNLTDEITRNKNVS